MTNQDCINPETHDTSCQSLKLSRPPYLVLSMCLVGTLIVAISGVVSVISGRSHLSSTINNQIQMYDATAQVRHIDEILTMSARMHAATEDAYWKERYINHIEPLDKAIASMRSFSPTLFDTTFGTTTEKANAKLIELETTSMDLVANGESQQALNLLQSDEYQQLKAMYATETESIISLLHQKSLDKATRDQFTQTVTLIAAGVVSPLTLIGWGVLLVSLIKYHNSLKRAIGVELIAEQERASNKAKSDFLANMSHEIRTPMTAILGYAEILSSDDQSYTEPEEFKEALGTIMHNSKHLLRVIDDILDISKIEAGRLQIEMVDTHIHQIVEEIGSLMRPVAIEKGLKLDIEYKGAIPDRIESDPTRLRQILMNLIGNAIKFTETGKVTLRIAYRPSPSRVVKTQAGEILFWVIDTGIGLTEDQCQRISAFGAFTQADASMSRRFGGTGLGLSISNSLATLIGGKISVQSQINAGSTFELCLPAIINGKSRMIDPYTTASSMNQDNAEHSITAPENPLLGKRVLLIEDGPDNQKLISHYLVKAGATVELADNGLIGFEAALDAKDNGRPFDLILTDMQMPVLDGYGAAKKMRNSGITTPIIAVTAHAMNHDAQLCLDAGCNDYTSKPINKKHLISICVKWIKHDQSVDQAA